MPNQDFMVDRSNLEHTALVDVGELTADDGEVVLAVDRFALTANNITYGVAGDSIGYWQFFPAESGKGRIPVWGIGHVTQSNVDGVKEGDRYYGYFPMSSELLVRPDRVSERGFVDAAAHRSELPPVYNQYSLMSEANGFEPKYDNHQMVYRPLFTTSFVLDDYLVDNDDFGADMILIGSASSKTGFGLAWMLRQSGRVAIAGLTSSKNRDFVVGTGLYDHVVSYDDVEELDASKKVAYVDMSGNREVLMRVHQHFADNLVCSCGVGITHWESRDGATMPTLPGAKPSMFFAPSQIQKRNKEWGPAEYQARLGKATAAFLKDVDRWVKIEEHPFSAVSSVYDTVLAGASPDAAYVVTSN